MRWDFRGEMGRYMQEFYFGTFLTLRITPRYITRQNGSQIPPDDRKKTYINLSRDVESSLLSSTREQYTPTFLNLTAFKEYRKTQKKFIGEPRQNYYPCFSKNLKDYNRPYDPQYGSPYSEVVRVQPFTYPLRTPCPDRRTLNVLTSFLFFLVYSVSFRP